MGDRAAPSCREFTPGGRARRTCGAPSSRSATRSSRSSRSRARRRAPSTRCAGNSAGNSTRRSGLEDTCIFTTRSARARTCSARSTRCSRRARSSPASRPTRPASRRITLTAGRSARAWSSCGRWSSPPKAKEIEGWDAPFDTESEESPRVLLARRIAGHVEALDGARPQGRRCAGSGASARAAVRGDHPRAEERGVPVAGADRLVLTEHIAVMDLMALADALLLPDDDLALGERAQEPAVRLERGAVVRRWPGTARDRCAQACAPSQRPRSAFADDEQRARRTCAQAAQSRRRSGSSRTCWAAARGRAQFLARLGPGGERRARRVSQSGARLRARETPSLQGFLAWLRARQSEVQARHGNGARRSARDDRARRQGSGSQHGHSCRHHHPPGGPRDPRCC